MPKQKQLPETSSELQFPVRGVDLSTEHAEQPPGTTPVGQNVRAHEAATDRMRGGSRPGLSRYIGTTPGGLGSVIQHLDVIVDPTTAALITPPGASEPDPANPGSYVPPGGTGAQPNPNNLWALAPAGEHLVILWRLTSQHFTDPPFFSAFVGVELASTQLTGLSFTAVTDEEWFIWVATFPLGTAGYSTNWWPDPGGLLTFDEDQPFPAGLVNFSGANTLQFKSQVGGDAQMFPISGTMTVAHILNGSVLSRPYEVEAVNLTTDGQTLSFPFTLP